MPSSSQHYHAIVIGSGQAGTPLCQALAAAGMRTALIERDHVGGTCVNEGCTPTKTMIASGRVAYLARRGADYGVGTGPIRIDMRKIRRRKRHIVNLFRGGNEKRIKQTKNLDLIFAQAAFTGPKSIELRGRRGVGRTFTADRIFINAGCRPAIPALPGLDKIPYLDSTSIMELAEVPKHLLVLGGGYIGLEFGQLFRRLGSRVTIVQRGPQLFSGEDSEVAEAVHQILKGEGIEVLLGTTTQSVSRSRREIAMKVRVGNKARTITGTHLLVATGRVPNSDALNLVAADIATDDRGFIRVNDKLETSAEGVFALGDIKGGPQFTHISYDDFRVIRTNVIERGNTSITGRLVPYTVFIDPQLGRIGLSETQAKSQSRTVRIGPLGGAADAGTDIGPK